MIAKNEENYIAQVITSVQSIVCEVILVDTGSTDRTIEIVEELGSTILNRPWDDDFAAPRNLSLEHATGDWILVLDADEVIAESDLKEMQDLTLSKGVCWEFLQRHYSDDQRMSNFSPCVGEYPKWEREHGGYFESNCCRLFPNHQGLNFQGRIHELVEHSIRQLGKHKVIRTRIPIHHYGHIVEVKKNKKKSTLYTPLGKQKAEEQPGTWKNHYELGVEHNCNGRLEESVAAFKTGLKLEPKYVPAWTNLGYVLCELGRFTEATEALNQALALDHKYAEAHCNLGVVHMRTGQWMFAEAHLRKAIELKNDYVNAYNNLGQTYLRLNQLPEAVEVFQIALELFPKNASANADLGAAYLSLGQLPEAKDCLERAVKTDPELSRSYFYLGQVYKATELASEAVKAFETFCNLEEEKYQKNPPPDMKQMIASVRNECETIKKGL